MNRWRSEQLKMDLFLGEAGGPGKFAYRLDHSSRAAAMYLSVWARPFDQRFEVNLISVVKPEP